jgi:uncharacterized protein YjbI with pentapeptide repeats
MAVDPQLIKEMPGIVRDVALYIAVAIPATVVLGTPSRMGLEWLIQTHAIRKSGVEQRHQITSDYLAKALNPEVPLAIRYQLLRFLATPDTTGARLQTWAERELERVEPIIVGADRAVATAERELREAVNAQQIANAETKLVAAFRERKSLLEPPIAPRLTAAALRAGLISDQKLLGLSMKSANLSRMHLFFRDMKGSDFSESNMEWCNLQGCDLRTSSFANANMTNANLNHTDLRACNFDGALLHEVNFLAAHLEGANLATANIKDCNFRATYDSGTKWPAGFDPEAEGAVLNESEA